MHHPILAELFSSFLQAEARHHSTGTMLFNRNPVSVASQTTAIDVLASFLLHSFYQKISVEFKEANIMRKEYMEILETLLDKLTLSAILEMLERICHKKAENLRTHWQDETSAKLWEKAARQIEQINVDV